MTLTCGSVWVCPAHAPYRCPVDYQMDITEGLQMYSVSQGVFWQDRNLERTGIKDHWDNFTRVLNVSDWLHFIPSSRRRLRYRRHA